MNLIAGAIQYISSFLTVCFMGNKLSDDQSKRSLEQTFIDQYYKVSDNRTENNSLI